MRSRAAAAVVGAAVALTGCAGDAAEEQGAHDPPGGLVQEALSWLPAAVADLEGGASVLDVAATAAWLEIDRPGVGASAAERAAYAAALAEREVHVGSWWRAATADDLRTTYGFDHADVARLAWTTSPGGQPSRTLVAVGRFDAAAIEAAAGDRAADGEDVRTATVDGVEYHVVGDDEGITQYRDQFSPARDLGQGYSIGVVDDMLVLTSSAAAMEEAIRAVRGDGPSVLDADERIRALAAQADELALIDAHVALRPAAYASGSRASGSDGVESALVVHVGDPAAAAAARDAFAEAAGDPAVISDRYDDVEVEVDGPLVTMRAEVVREATTAGGLFGAVIPWCRAQAGQPDSPCVLPPGP